VTTRRCKKVRHRYTGYSYYQETWTNSVTAPGLPCTRVHAYDTTTRKNRGSASQAKTYQRKHQMSQLLVVQGTGCSRVQYHSDSTMQSYREHYLADLYYDRFPGSRVQEPYGDVRACRIYTNVLQVLGNRAQLLVSYIYTYIPAIRASKKKREYTPPPPTNER
jgi:hypothetical protein